jgi:hypothetical protein
VRSRKLTVSVVKLERVRRSVQVCLDELEPKDGRRSVENWCAEQPAFAIEIDDLRHLAVQHTLVPHASVEKAGNSYFEHESNLRSQADYCVRHGERCRGLQEPDLLGLRADCGIEPTFQQITEARTSFTHASG